MNRSTVYKSSLAVLLLAILTYNFIIAYDLRTEVDGDAWDYIHIGLSMAKTGNFAHLKSSRAELLQNLNSGEIKSKSYKLGKAAGFRPPIWPLLLAGIFSLFGYCLTYVIVFKFLLHGIGILLFFKTLKLLELSKEIVITGAFLYGISPAWQLYSRVFLSEPITLFFITLWIYFLIRYLKKKSSFLPHGILAGIFILAHPYYLFLPFSVYLIFFIKKILNFRTFIFSSIIAASIVSMWIVRNFVVLDTDQVILTTSSGAVMAKGWNKKVPAEHTNTKGDLADETLVLENYQYSQKNRNEVEKMQLYKDASLDFIRTNPDMILPIIGRKLLSAFNPFPETVRPGFLETGRWLFHFLSLLSLVYILIFSRSKLITSLTLGLILSTVAITIFTYSGFRFRMPQVGLELLLIMFVINHVMLKKKYFQKDHKLP